jgi:hypothetical protein
MNDFMILIFKIGRGDMPKRSVVAPTGFQISFETLVKRSVALTMIINCLPGFFRINHPQPVF